MAARPYAGELQPQVALVAQRHRIPAGRLADHQQVGLGLRLDHVPGSHAAGRLLAHGADHADGERLVHLLGHPGHGGQCGAQRPLRVDGAPAVQRAASLRDGNDAGHRIRMTEERDRQRPTAVASHEIARPVDDRLLHPALHRGPQAVDDLRLAARGAGRPDGETEERAGELVRLSAPRPALRYRPARREAPRPPRPPPLR